MNKFLKARIAMFIKKKESFLALSTFHSALIITIYTVRQTVIARNTLSCIVRVIKISFIALKTLSLYTVTTMILAFETLYFIQIVTQLTEQTFFSITVQTIWVPSSAVKTCRIYKRIPILTIHAAILFTDMAVLVIFCSAIQAFLIIEVVEEITV